MSTKGTYFRVGIFVILASVIGIAAIIVFGAAELIPRKSFVVETYMDDSVQGLEVGSKVKSHGVEIGKVEEITFADSEYQIPDDYIFEHGRFVLIRMVVYPEMIGEASGKLDMDVFKRAVEAGMR
ncbi:MAG: MlaD family protein, partial [Acidobacteriota bacterium]